MNKNSKLVWLRVEPLHTAQVTTLSAVSEYLIRHGIQCEVNELRMTLVVRASCRWITALPLLFTVSVREYASLVELLSEYDADNKYRVTVRV